MLYFKRFFIFFLLCFFSFSVTAFTLDDVKIRGSLNCGISEKRTGFADVNSDGELNVVDIVNIVGMVLDTSFAQSVEWLDEHFPQLDVRGRLQTLNYNWESTE